jgi:hypothetical protein
VHIGVRQCDLEGRSGVPRRRIGELEHGIVDHLSLDDLVKLTAALGATIDVRIRWNGEQLDRVVDAAHAATVAAVLERLTRDGWDSVVEASFSVWGERGAIDVLGWHPATATLLVIEVKSVIPDLQSMLGGLDRKARLAPKVAADRGWRPRAIGRLVVVADSPTSRGRVRRHDVVLRIALPDRSSSVRRWLATPSGVPIAGLVFMSNVRHSHTRRSLWRRERVRVRKSPRSCTPRTE